MIQNPKPMIVRSSPRAAGPLLLRVLLTFACLGAFTSLRALEMVPLPIAELSGRAQVVVLGRVLSKTCQTDPEGRIYTVIDLDVTEVWKGETQPGRMNILQGGGTLGNRRSMVSGQAEYNLGEEIVAFLVRNGRGEAVTLGLAQGKFHVWQDARTGEKLARNPFHGGRASESESGRTARAASQGAADSERLPLARLKQQVQGGVR